MNDGTHDDYLITLSAMIAEQTRWIPIGDGLSAFDSLACGDSAAFTLLCHSERLWR
jgi:hypothetical protein